MRAVEIREPGLPPEPADCEPPRPARGQVLVAVAAAPITPLDLLCATGLSYFGRPQTPYIPGVQGVGVVGSRPVWFPTSAGMAPGDGSMAQFAAVAEQDLVALPDGADPVAVAALGLSAVAAHQALGRRGGLAAGEQVIVLGAGGTVGQAAVQLAKLAGARRVVAAARSAAAQERAEAAGADAVVALGTDDIADLAVRFVEACDGPADLVLDTLYGVPAAAAARALGRGGRLVNLGAAAAETSPLDSSTLRGKSLRVLGYTNNELTREQRAAAITEVARLSARGRLSVAHQTAPLEAAAGLWRLQADGKADGRIVLVPGS